MPNWKPRSLPKLDIVPAASLKAFACPDQDFQKVKRVYRLERKEKKTKQSDPKPTENRL